MILDNSYNVCYFTHDQSGQPKLTTAKMKNKRKKTWGGGGAGAE